MRNMRINKKAIYMRPLMKREEGYGTPVYGDIYVFKESITPITGDSDIVEFGDKIFKSYKSTPPLKKWKGKIKEGDVAYLEGTSPFDENEQSIGNNANYKVTSVREALDTLLIVFERMV